jgi:hypothetical protein
MREQVVIPAKVTLKKLVTMLVKLEVTTVVHRGGYLDLGPLVRLKMNRPLFKPDKSSIAGYFNGKSLDHKEATVHITGWFGKRHVRFEKRIRRGEESAVAFDDGVRLARGL